MTYWRCIKCAYTHIKGNIVRFQCHCGHWCIDITRIAEEMKSKGDLTADEINEYQRRLEYRCLGTFV